MFLYSSVSNPLDCSKRFTLFALPGRPVHSDTNSASTGSILARQQLRAKTKSLTFPPLSIGLYRDVWIAAIASSRKSPATQTAAICARFQGRRVRHVYVTMHVTFLTRISALIYRRGLRQRVASLTLDCNGVFAIRAYSQVLIYTAESTGASLARTKIHNLRNGNKGEFDPGLTWLRVRHSTTVLPRST